MATPNAASLAYSSRSFSSGGGAGKLISTPSKTTSATTAPSAPAKTGSYVAGKGFVTSTGQTYPTTSPTFVPEGFTTTTPSTGTVFTVPITGGVKVGTATYSGTAVVPGTGGMSAVQYKGEVYKQAVSSGAVSPGQESRYSYTIQQPKAIAPPLSQSMTGGIAAQQYSFYPNKPFISEKEAGTSGLGKSQLNLFNIIPSGLDPSLALQAGQKQAELTQPMKLWGYNVPFTGGVHYPGKIDMTIASAIDLYSKTETKIASYTAPAFSGALEKIGVTKENYAVSYGQIGGAIVSSHPIIGAIEYFYPQSREIINAQIGKFGVHFLYSASEAPLKTALIYGTAAVLPSGLGWAGVGAGAGMKGVGFSESTIATLATYAGYGGKVVTLGMGGLYVGSKAIEIAMNPSEAGAILGRAASTELLPAFLGGATSRYADIKFQEYYINKAQKSIGGDFFGEGIGKTYKTSETTGIQVLSAEKISSRVNVKETGVFPYKMTGGVAEVSGATGATQLKYVSPITGQTRLFTSNFDIEGIAYPIKGGFGTGNLNIGTTGTKWTYQDYMFTKTSQSIKLGYGKEKIFNVIGEPFPVRSIAASTEDYFAVGKGSDVSYWTMKSESGKAMSTGLSKAGYLKPADINLYGGTETFTGIEEIRADIIKTIRFNFAGQGKQTWGIPLSAKGGKVSMFPLIQQQQPELTKFITPSTTQGGMTMISPLPLNYQQAATSLIPPVSYASPLVTLGLHSLFNTGIQTRVSVKSMTTSMQTPIQTIIPFQITTPISTQTQIQNQIQSQIQIPVQTQITTPITSIITPIFEPPFIPFVFPSLGWGSLGEFTSPRKTKGRKYRRVPSLAAGILGYKAPKVAIGEITGIVTRPILTSPRRVKRRKK